MQNYNSPENPTDISLHLKQQIIKYATNWKWFLLGVFVCVALAKMYLRYAIPEYRATAKILIKNEQGGVPSELAAFEDLGILSNGNSNIDDEIEVLKSRSLIGKTFQKGLFNISYVIEGRIKGSEAYKVSPIVINFLNKPKDFYEKDTIIKVNTISKETFELLDVNGDVAGVFKYGAIIKSKGFGEFTIEKSKDGKFEENDEISINVNSINKCIDAFKNSYEVSTLAKYSNVLELSFKDKVKDKAEDFLDALIAIYNEDAIADKRMVSEKTGDFINDRLKVITEELDGVEKNAENYKKLNKITDLPTESGLVLENASENNKNAIGVDTQIRVVDLMLDYVKNNSKWDIIPANIVPEDNNSASLIAEYNNLIIERNRILKSSTEQNPLVVRLSDKIGTMRSSIQESLFKLKSSLMVKNNEIGKQEGMLLGRISKIPKQEREYRGIFRQQQVKEELFLYLFKKREENAITLAATAPISKIVDQAYASKIPVTPNRLLVYFVAGLIGLIIPFLFFYLKDLLDTKVKSRSDIETLGIPFIGDVPHSETNNEIIKPDSRTSSAEAIRIVRTNIEFILNSVKDNMGKTIFLTSTLPAEGKTFIAVNLAGTIAISGKKVLLVGLDIRNPRLNEYLNVPNKGVTNYLSTSKANIDDFIYKQNGYENFYVLPAGVIPPNPAELLMNDKVVKMFEDLKQKFDYIVVDTAPVSLVTDTLLVSSNADAFIYVVRANYLEKQMLNVPLTLYKDKKLPNMSLLLNDVEANHGYGYGYGYVSEKKNKNWFKKLFAFLPFVS